MRLFSLLVATCALCQTAFAQTPDCKSISEPTARLACYDRGATTVVPVAPGPAARAVPPSKVDSNKYVDSISAEDAIMNERMKGICRGC